MKIKAKFKVESVKKFAFGEEVEMNPVYEGGTANRTEDKHFADATPSGSLKIFISNKDVHGHFVPGDAHYLTFEKAE